MIRTDALIIGAGPTGLFTAHQLKLIGLKCEDNFIHSGLTVRELSQKFPDYLANIMFIFRGDKKFTVNSSTKIEKNARAAIATIIGSINLFAFIS